MALTERPFVDFSTPIRFDLDTVIVEVRGELDCASAPQMEEVLDQLIAEGARNVVVDLAEATFVDTTGLGALLAGLRRMREHEGVLSLASPRPSARRVLELSGLDRVFPLV